MRRKRAGVEVWPKQPLRVRGSAPGSLLLPRAGRRALEAE